MSKQEPKKRNDKLRNHEYDGIQEYDNSPPRWLMGLFFFSIGFAVVYLIYYHVANGPSISDEYNASVKAGAVISETGAAPADLAAITHDSAAIAAGRVTYLQNCMPCHGEKGEGKIGPNLADNYWLHGGKPENIQKTIADGVPEKGMLAWKMILGEKKIQELVAFILSIHGTNPPDAKAPQGTLESK